MNDEFLREKQNIRDKMLRFSKAISQGKPLDDDLKDELDSNYILKKRINHKNKHKKIEFYDDDYEKDDFKKTKISLKSDLVNIKIDEKQDLVFNFINKIKEKRKEKKIKKEEKSKEIKIKKQVFKNLIESINKKREERKKNKEIKRQEKENKKALLEKLKEKKKQEELLKQQIIIQKPKQIDMLYGDEIEEDSSKTKNTLLEDFAVVRLESKNLNYNHLIFASLMVCFAIFLFVPQIYIRNQIYYLSREIAILKTQESVLNEENKELKRKLENMRFQNQILDYLE